MKTILILTLLLLLSEGFNLNKLGRNSGNSRNYLNNVDPTELEQEIYLGNSLLEKGNPWYLGNTGLDVDEFALLGRKGDLGMVSRVIEC